jgi:CyaY protein
MSDEALSERDFDAAADRSLRALDQRINEIADGVEADLESGILTLEFEDGEKYVVNSHRAARQIWMAAERTAWHFDYRRGEGGSGVRAPTHGEGDRDRGSPADVEHRWIAAKTGEELWSTVESVVSRKLGRPVKLAR